MWGSLELRGKRRGKESSREGAGCIDQRQIGRTLQAATKLRTPM